MTSTTFAIECNSVKKSFGSVNALKGASIQARPGEVTAIVGDNGAGKTTLIKCIAGVYQPDEGNIKINGSEISFDSPESARVAGIETVYQNLSLVEDLTIYF
jgi:D-xylose transport system ATP-binding protein